MAERIDNPDLELMRRYDGEAKSGGESAEDADAKLEALEQLSAAFVDAMEAEAESSASDDAFASMWSRIEHKISANGAAKHAPTEDAATDRPAPASPGLLEAIGGWFERYRSQFLTGAVCAAAAAVLVWFVRPPEKTVEYVEVQARSNGTSTAPTIIPAKLESQPAEVESLEVYDGSGVVLTIPSDGDDDAPTTVIWLSPPENSVEGPI